MPISSVRFVPRDVPLPVVRVASVFANADKGDDEKNTDNSEDSRTEDSFNLEKVGNSHTGKNFTLQNICSRK